jgi:NADH-quinone oxidoreductase subunit G
MVKLTIDGKTTEAPENTTLLDAAEQMGIHIPTLCYLQGICEVGACRICAVEIDGDANLSAACNTPVAEGMVVRTQSPRAREARRGNLSLLLMEHNVNCTACVRGGTCALQALCGDMGIKDIPYPSKTAKAPWPGEFPLQRDESKCVKCMRCIQVCGNMQSLGVWGLGGSGSRAGVGVNGGEAISKSDCAVCGQCTLYCPVGALTERDDGKALLDAIADPDKTVMVQIAPAVRAAWGEGLGLSREEATVGKMVAAVRKLGVDYVFDTNFGADLTIMEEGSELLGKLIADNALPMFTSCCPGWVNFARTQYPELLASLSTAKSPQQMFGAVCKGWFAERAGLERDKVFCVSVMPCVAKKQEREMDGTVDASLTVRELIRLLKSFSIKAEALEEDAFDDVLGEASGAGVIFGATGGVMEAALRSAVYLATGANPEPDAFNALRGAEAVKEAVADINGSKVRVAVVSGLGEARELIEKIKTGEAAYDFVEVMACPGGCSGGGGQPIKSGTAPAGERAPVLYALDKNAGFRFSHENPAIKCLYDELLGKPLSSKAHALLHRDYN